LNDTGLNESITPEGIVALRAELEQLEGPARTEMAARIKTARELGDLKENADYHIAKDDQGRVIDGWWVGFLVDDDGVWEAHKRGERPEFSIGGRAKREPA